MPLFDGKGLSGWKAGEHPNSFQVRNGTIVCGGPRAHLFYAGDAKDADFKNFELKAEVMTTPGAESGIFFHTEYREQGFPNKGYQAQINNTHTAQGYGKTAAGRIVGSASGTVGR